MIETEEMIASDADIQWNAEERKPQTIGGRLYINPFGVVLGRNISGQARADESIDDKAFVATVERFGVFLPVIVRKVDYQGFKAYQVVAGNRRTYTLRQVVAKGTFSEGDEKALLPIYEMNERLDLEHVSAEDAANLLENSMRKGLDHISKAQAIDRLITRGATQEELALLVKGPKNKPLGKEAIRQYRTLLKLQPKLQDAVRNGVMQVSIATRLVDLSVEEQLMTLQAILDAQGLGGNKVKATEDAVRKLKAAKRVDRFGEPIHDDLRSIADIRRVAAQLRKVEAWDCIPKAPKLSNLGYQVVAEIFEDLNEWFQGAMTPKKYDPKDIALALRTRILANVARVAPR